ncbi:MAG: transposase, partial [Thermoguttaceae bacterium]|nr:transposase [Thermoguttaceae bacterium]
MVKRKNWKNKLKNIDENKVIYLDETSAKTNMTPTYGRSLKGKRLVDHTPHGHWMTITGVFGLTLNGLVAPYVFTGGMTNVRFVDYITNHIIPLVRKGYTIICDNLASHKQKIIAEILEAHGARQLLLPAYSPDLNPIEMSFSKVKTLLRKAKLRTVDQVVEFLQNGPEYFTPNDCHGYFSKTINVA